MFDPIEFFSVAVAGVPLIFVVLGLVTLYGQFGLQGKVQLASSFATGLILGGAYQLAEMGVPAGFAGWFAIIIYGLALGLVATGTYETYKQVINKSVSKQLGDEPYGRG